MGVFQNSVFHYVVCSECSVCCSDIQCQHCTTAESTVSWQKRFAVRVKYDKKDNTKTTLLYCLHYYCMQIQTQHVPNVVRFTYNIWLLWAGSIVNQSSYKSESLNPSELTSDSLTRCLYGSAVKDHFKIMLKKLYCLLCYIVLINFVERGSILQKHNSIGNI